MDTKVAEVKVIDPEENGISISISGEDKEKVIISESGNIVLSQALDYEKEKLKFIVDVFDGKNCIDSTKIKIDNVNDLTASVNLSNTTVHEGISSNSIIGDIDVNGDSELSYSISVKTVMIFLYPKMEKSK